MQHLAVSDSPKIIWTADVGAGTSSSRVLTTPPIMADGKVFVKDAQSTVSAFDAETGKLIWRVTLAPEKARDTDEFGGGLSYYGGRLFVTTGFASVFSLDPADGKEIWNSSVSAPVRGAPLVFGDRVFAISIDRRPWPPSTAGPWQYTALRKRGLRRGNGKRSADYILAARRRLVGRAHNHRRETMIGARGDVRLRQPADIRGRPVIDRGLVLTMVRRASSRPSSCVRQRVGARHRRARRRGQPASCSSHPSADIAR
jgi:hypothetical protein